MNKLIAVPVRKNIKHYTSKQQRATKTNILQPQRTQPKKGPSFRKLATIEAELTSEVKLKCKREAGNEHDKFAISLWYNDTKAGYIPRDKNEVIDRLLDAGKTLFSVLQTKKWEATGFGWISRFI